MSNFLYLIHYNYMANTDGPKHLVFPLPGSSSLQSPSLATPTFLYIIIILSSTLPGKLHP